MMKNTVDEMFGSSLIVFRGPSRCKYDVLYAYGGGINRCASMSPAHPLADVGMLSCWVDVSGDQPLNCIDLRYGMRC